MHKEDKDNILMQCAEQGVGPSAAAPCGVNEVGIYLFACSVYIVA